MTNTTFPASSPVFDLLEALSERFPTICGCYARYTGGVHWEPIIAAVKSPTIPAGMVAEIEALAQFLHDEGGFGDAMPDRTWPEHPDDTGQREGGWVKIVPSDVQAHFRDVARRWLLPRLAAAPKQAEPQGVEDRAWGWIDATYQNVEAGHDPNDRDYSPDDMVDAFIAGHAAALNAPTGAVEKGETE